MFSELRGPGFDAIKPRIFQIGFNKCGTRTFFKFLRNNGIKSVHYRRGELARTIHDNINSGRQPLEGIDKWVGYTDMQEVKITSVIEACDHYRSLAAYYPRSYFILNTRNKERWIQSRLNHGQDQNYGSRYRQGLGLATIDETVAVWSRIWDQHHDEAPRFFAQTGQHFLLYDIEKDTPDRLSDFLSPDFQTDPSTFGHEGKTEAAVADKMPIRSSVSEAVTHVRTAPAAQAKALPEDRLDDRLIPKFRPHNHLVNFDETVAEAPYRKARAKPLAAGSTGNVIVATVRNEGAFLLEWIAHHRAIGFHHFLIFTYRTSDGTDKLLNRLQDLEIVTHVKIDEWHGKSPWTFALEKAVLSPVVFNAEWVAHIDVDEFINIRTGNGTFACLLKAVPENVTNIAMTRRSFGSDGATTYTDDLTIERFEKCSPAYLPKPHNAWGFKTATRNIGAYGSLSYHRPSNLADGYLDELFWVNGSGKDITTARAKSGWRSDIKTIGYDLVQLNHYAVRSIDDFLIRCDAERDLEGQMITGAGYWNRLDWNSHQDVTIQRNARRVRNELKELKQAKKVQRLHERTVAWRKAKAAELRKSDEFADLIVTVKSRDIDDTDRVLGILDHDSDL